MSWGHFEVVYGAFTLTKSTNIPYFFEKLYSICYFFLWWVGKVVWEPTKAKFFQGKLPRKAFSKSALQDRGRALVPHLCVCALIKWVNVIPKEKAQKEILPFLPNALTTSGWAVKWTAMRRLLADFTWKQLIQLENWIYQRRSNFKFLFPESNETWVIEFSWYTLGFDGKDDNAHRYRYAQLHNGITTVR